MSDRGEKLYWMGTPVEELTREQLIDALYQSAQETRYARELHMRSEDMHRMFAEARRARGP